MSPGGKERTRPTPRLKRDGLEGAFSNGARPASAKGGDTAAVQGALPLRLSVAQGGLGIELSRAVELPLGSVREFEVGLLGVQYPVDLSKGVKQFRNRKSYLRRAVVAIDLIRLGDRWASAIRQFWGENVTVRVRPVVVAAEESSGDTPPAQNEAQELESLAITCLSDNAALAFDLVICSGPSPRLVVDAPRHWGAEPKQSAMGLALSVLDAIMGEAAGETNQESAPPFSVSRSGRVLELSGLAEILSLGIFPDLGCRLPDVRDQVIVDMRLVRGELTVEIGRQQEPYAATRRGLRVSGAADLLHRGDVLLSSGDPAGARAAYLDVLQTAPGHPDLLLELAEIDLAEGSRAESCLSFLEELDKSPIQPLSRESTVRRHLTWSRALVASGRQDAARESLAAAQSLEVDGIMAALFACDLSESVKGDARRSELLDEAVARAPLLPRARRMHFDFSLSRGDQSAAARDAEQLEAACTSAEERALVCISLAEAYMEAGYPDQTERWLRRGLRFRPDDARLQLRLAWGLAQTKQPLRAAELLTAALHTLGAQREGLTALEHVPTSALEELSTLQGQAHFQLAELLVEVNDDLPSALAHLSSVPSRSALAAKARVLESELFHRMGRLSERDRVLGRLLEAVELGWIPAQDVREQKERLLNLLSLEPESATTRSLHRVLAEPV